jgi:HlyD family secretion protein
MNDASSRLAELRAQQVSLDEFDAREKDLQASLGGVEKRRLQRTIEFSHDRLERLRSRRGVVDRLVTEGMMIEVDREKVDEEIEGTLVAIQQAELEIEQRTAKERNTDFQRERDALNRRLQGDEAQRKVAMIKSRLERESEVRSPFAGRIVEVRAAVQNAITVGDPILLVEPSGAERGELEAILYVSAATGKRIQKGMDVDLSPSTVKPEEFGALRGKVSSIAEVPTSRSAMMAVLSDLDLVEKFSREIGLPLEMRVSLTPDTSTPSGYKWSSSQGPPIRISAGTLCSGSVTVRRQSPLSLVVPLARRQLGAD